MARYLGSMSTACFPSQPNRGLSPSTCAVGVSNGRGVVRGSNGRGSNGRGSNGRGSNGRGSNWRALGAALLGVGCIYTHTRIQLPVLHLVVFTMVQLWPIFCSHFDFATQAWGPSIRLS